MDSNSERKCDDSTPSKEELDTSCISMKETVLKRERIKEYSFNHRVSFYSFMGIYHSYFVMKLLLNT